VFAGRVAAQREEVIPVEQNVDARLFRLARCVSDGRVVGVLLR
jgi:hypothetical protein